MKSIPDAVRFAAERNIDGHVTIKQGPTHRRAGRIRFTWSIEARGKSYRIRSEWTSGGDEPLFLHLDREPWPGHFIDAGQLPDVVLCRRHSCATVHPTIGYCLDCEAEFYAEQEESHKRRLRSQLAAVMLD